MRLLWRVVCTGLFAQFPGIPLLMMALLITAVSHAQTAPNIENGFKSFGSYQSGDLDTVNLHTGNVMFHVPLFSYPQRGGKLSANSIVLYGSSKNWQVGDWADKQRTIHQKWILKESPGVYSFAPSGISFTDPATFEIHRTRHRDTDFSGNQTYRIDDYAIATSDGGWHWLAGGTPSGHLMTMDGSGIQAIITPGSKPDHSDDTATVIMRDGTRYFFSNISVPIPDSGQGNNLTGKVIQPELVLDDWGTTQTAYDGAWSADATVTDANGNILPVGSDTLGRNGGSGSATSDYSGCVTSRTITSASFFNASGPDGRNSTMKVCLTAFTPTAAFSQANVDPPSRAATQYQLDSYAQGIGNYIGSIVMPDGNHWSFDYDDFGDITKITLPTGGTINYQWTEISDGCGDGSLTRVSRAVLSRTVNDNNGHSYPWNYTLGPLAQDGSITNYVKDPNGNETAHMFRSVTTSPCDFYEVETRSYQGTHTSGTLLKTVGTHYRADYGYTETSAFAADVVPDTITTTLPNGRVSQIVRQYDPGPGGTMTTYGKVTDEKVYDYGNGAPGALLRETATTYQWQQNSSYLDAGFLDLPATVVVKDGSGCALAETDYTYDEPTYLATYTGTLPAGTHGAAPNGSVRGNLTTVTKWLAAASSCNPKAGTAIASHTNWYDTGEPHQTFDPLGHKTTLSYDSAYAGAYVTETCSPQTNGVSHCVSGTYDFTTGLLESLTNENAASQASGNTQGDVAHTSNYTYDTSWRLIQAQAPPDPANNNARSTASFTPSTPNAFPLSVQRQRLVTTTLSDSSTTYFDGLERANQTTHALPNGTATVLTSYDGLGQVTSVTNPYFSTADPTYGIAYPLYDALGRTTQTTKQDGSISSASYDQLPAAGQGVCTTSTDEAGNQRRTCADALGRLVEVDEPNPAAAAVPAQGTLTISGTLQSHTSSGSPAAKASGSVNIWSGDGSGADMHFDDPSEPCPPLPQTCQQIYDSGWVRITINGIVSQVNYGQFNTQTGIASSLASAINSSGANVYVTASVIGGTTISLQAKNAGAVGNSITLSSTSASNDPGDFGGGSFGGTASASTLTGGADAINPVTTYDQGTVTLTIGSFTASAPYSQSGDSTAVLIATALVGTGSTGLNRSGSSVSATANGATITITYGTAGSVGNGVAVTGSSQSTQTQWTFSPPSFTSAGTTLGNGLNAGDVNNNPLITLYQYDGLGDLTCVEQHGGVTGTGCSSAPSNDATSPWRVRRFTYDTLGRLLTATNPESGTISYTHDAYGNLLQKTSPAPNQANSAVTQTVSYCYDELHRITGKGYGAQSCPLASPVVSYTYDSGPNAKGKLVSMTDQAGTMSYSYDILGRLSSETRSLTGANNAAISKTLSYEYNLDSSLAKLHYPSGAVIAYTPDSAGRTVSAVDSVNNINYVTGGSYGPDSFLTGFVSGSGGAAAITSSFSYNKRLQPVAMSAATASQTVFSIGYDFHSGNGTAGSGADNGNVFGIYNYRDRNRDQSFTYDALNRLTAAQNAGNGLHPQGAAEQDRILAQQLLVRCLGQSAQQSGHEMRGGEPERHRRHAQLDSRRRNGLPVRRCRQYDVQRHGTNADLHL